MKTFIQITKIKTVLLYIMQSFPKGVECAKLFRILYFAQQDYLVKYGKVLIEDSFMALKYGPAPTYIYRVLQAVEEKPTEESFNDFLAGIEVHEKKIYASAKPDMNYISGSDKRCLDAAITKILMTCQTCHTTRHGKKQGHVLRIILKRIWLPS